MQEKWFVPASDFRNRKLWSDVLPCWLRLLRKYESATAAIDPDLAYWHGEQALTGLLATAASEAKGWGLQEFCASNKRSKKVNCHGDLWFGRGDASVTVEAKMCWRPGEKPQEKLKAAARKLKQLESGGAEEQWIALCYVVPCYKDPKAKARGSGDLRELDQWAQSCGIATALHLSQSKITSWRKRSYPGVLLLAKECTR